MAPARLAPTVPGVNGLVTPPIPAHPWPAAPAAGAGHPTAQAAPSGPRGAPAPALPADLGPEQSLPGYSPRRTTRRTAPRHRQSRGVADVLWIPAVSHLPSRAAVLRQSRRGVQAIALGVACVSLSGAGILGWDLWGSTWYAERQQTALARELVDMPPVALPAVEPPPAPAPAAPGTGVAEPAAPAPVALPAPAPQLLVEHAEIGDGSAVGRLLIGAIGVDEAFVYGTGVDDLKKGPGLWKWGVAPGQPGNAMISGHRTTYGAPFHDLDKLVPGDRITIQISGQPDAVYEVRGTQIVTPQDVQVSDQTGGVRLTMTACHPLGSAKERIVVQAELVEGANAAYALPADQWTFQK